MKITPLLTLLLFALTFAGISGMELHGLLSKRGELQDKAQINRTKQRDIETRKKNLADLTANRESIESSIRKIVGSISQEAPVAATFLPLYDAGVSVELQPSAHDAWNFRFGPTELEFHRLLPVLNALENEYPLLRISQLELVSKAEPFAKTATALRVQGTFLTVKPQKDIQP